MFIGNEQLRNETPVPFLFTEGELDRITKLMDGGNVLVVKYLGLGNLLM